VVLSGIIAEYIGLYDLSLLGFCLMSGEERSSGAAGVGCCAIRLEANGTRKAQLSSGADAWFVRTFHVAAEASTS
jgi:hypothetical protein